MNKLDIRNIRFTDFAYGFNKSLRRDFAIRKTA